MQHYCVTFLTGRILALHNHPEFFCWAKFWRVGRVCLLWRKNNIMSRSQIRPKQSVTFIEPEEGQRVFLEALYFINLADDCADHTDRHRSPATTSASLANLSTSSSGTSRNILPMENSRPGICLASALMYV